MPKESREAWDHNNEGGFAGDGFSDLGFDECRRVFYEEGTQGLRHTAALCAD